MKRLSIVSALAFVCAALLVAVPVLAATVAAWSGRLADPAPTWDRVGDDCSPATGLIEWYETQVFSVDVSGSYTITMIAMTGAISPDGFFALYDTSFSSGAPQTNCVATDDDGGGGLAPMLTVNLQEGRTYVLVTTQCCDGTSAGEEVDYTNEIAGPGNITLGTPEAAPLENTCTYALPEGLSQGRLNRTVNALWAPDPAAETNVVLPGGSAWHVMSTDGDYARLYIACEGSPVWVLRADLSPVAP